MTCKMNRLDLSPTRILESSPVVLTEPDVPVSVTSSARPPHSPFPKRVSTNR